MAQVRQLVSTAMKLPDLIKNIKLDDLILEILKSTKIPKEDFDFAKDIIVYSYHPGLRGDNFCIDLTLPKASHDASQIIPLGTWGKMRSKAFGKLFSIFSTQAANLLKEKQDKKIATSVDVQLMWLKLPKQTDANREEVNRIIKYAANNGYQDLTGNEDWISLQRFINSQKSNPVKPFQRIVKSVSVVVVTEIGKVLLLKRGGASGRAGTWGTLTGRIECDETNEKTIAREVHEEINVLLGTKKAHLLGIAHTQNIGKDLADKGKAVTYADDNSFVYAIAVTEKELRETIALSDGENSHWGLFDREELHKLFANCHTKEIHGDDIDTSEIHVALAKSLLALDAAENDFKDIYPQKFTYPYTDSRGLLCFFRPKQDRSAAIAAVPEQERDLCM